MTRGLVATVRKRDKVGIGGSAGTCGAGEPVRANTEKGGKSSIGGVREKHEKKPLPAKLLECTRLANRGAWGNQHDRASELTRSADGKL